MLACGECHKCFFFLIIDWPHAVTRFSRWPPISLPLLVLSQTAVLPRTKLALTIRFHSGMSATHALESFPIAIRHKFGVISLQGKQLWNYLKCIAWQCLSPPFVFFFLWNFDGRRTGSVVFPTQIMWRYPGESFLSKLDIFMVARSLLNEHHKDSNLLGIVTWPALGKQNRQAKKEGLLW